MLQWQTTLRSLWLTQGFSLIEFAIVWAVLQGSCLPWSYSGIQETPVLWLYPIIIGPPQSPWHKAADSAMGFSLPQPGSARGHFPLARTSPVVLHNHKETGKCGLQGRIWEGAIGNRIWWSQDIVSSMQGFSNLIPPDLEGRFCLVHRHLSSAACPEAPNVRGPDLDLEPSSAQLQILSS